MPTYPSLPQAQGTKLVERTGMLLRTATNGKSRPRALTSGPLYDPVLIHPLITQAELDTLKAFRLANRGSEFDVLYQPENQTIACYFSDKPLGVDPVPIGGGVALFNVTVTLIQVEAE